MSQNRPWPAGRAAAWPTMPPPIGIGTATLESGPSSTSLPSPVATRALADNRPTAPIAAIRAKLATRSLRNQDNVVPVCIEVISVPIGVNHSQQPRARQLSDAVDDARLRELVTPKRDAEPGGTNSSGSVPGNRAAPPTLFRRSIAAQVIDHRRSPHVCRGLTVDRGI